MMCAKVARVVLVGALVGANAQAIWRPCRRLLRQADPDMDFGNEIIPGKSPGLDYAGTVHYPDGTEVVPIYYERGILGAIQITEPNGRKNTYERINRRLKDYHLPPAVVASLQGKVADLGCGGGNAVADLRTMHVDAHGVDIYLTEAQKQLSYMHQADAKNTGFADGEYNAVISNSSIFTYPETKKRYQADYEYTQKILQEVKRITKVRGNIIIAGITKAAIKSAVAATAGLQITDSGPPPYPWVVLTRAK